MHGNRGIDKHDHSRAHRGTNDDKQPGAHFAQLTDADAISEFRWQCYRHLVHPG
jgi:hypothetical protein